MYCLVIIFPVVLQPINKMEGKVVIITGSNRGIGKETAKALAKKGAKVILACRNIKSADYAKKEIIQETNNRQVFVEKLDLSSQKSIRKFAENVKSLHRLDVLIHNAGVCTNESRFTKDKLELTMAVNYLGPFLLTHLLIDLLKKSAPSRIVVLGSITYICSLLDLHNLNPSNYIFPRIIYCNSKYAVMSFTKELARRLKDTGVTANCLHPGSVDTDMWETLPEFLQLPLVLARKFFLVTPAEGCRTSVFLASSNEVGGVTGKYFVDCKQRGLWGRVNDVEEAKKLWELTKRVVNLKSHDPKI